LRTHTHYNENTAESVRQNDVNIDLRARSHWQRMMNTQRIRNPVSGPSRACVLLVLLGFAQAGFTQGNPTKTVLALYDGGREFSSIQLTDRGIETTLNEAFSTHVTIFREYMDLTRVGPPNYEQVLRDFYRSKYSSNRPDVIVAVRGRALDFLLKRGDELFPGVPIVSAAMDLRQVNARRLPSHVTGTYLQVKYWPTVALALTLQPLTEQVAIVIGSSSNDRALEALVRDELREHEGRLQFTYLAGMPLDALLQRVSTLPPRTVVLFVALAQDGNGRSFKPDDAVTLVSRTANAPTYINSEDVLDCGAVGGDLISFSAVGRDAGNLALRILGGEKPANIPFTESSVRAKTLDARQLERWHIAPARVPSGTVVTNRIPSVWEAYRWRIVGGVILVLFQSALITVLLLHRRRRRLAEQNLRVSEAQKQGAVLEERSRMARDVHDALAQGFTGVIVQLEAAKTAFAHGASADSDAHVRRASELARQSLGEARRSIRALRPQALEDGGTLCVALDRVMKQMTAGTGLRAEFSTSGSPRSLSPANEDNLFRIYQELLTNALKHSAAKTIEAVLSFETNAIRLQLQDDGAGFDLATKHEGFGLIGIRERVKQMKGELMVDTQAGFGTRICVVLPDASEPRDSAAAQLAG
jgi:signal transduction histidine kinase